jgi:hypothetical protein
MNGKGDITLMFMASIVGGIKRVPPSSFVFGGEFWLFVILFF